jgi:hypothetical protein
LKVLLDVHVQGAEQHVDVEPDIQQALDMSLEAEKVMLQDYKPLSSLLEYKPDSSNTTKQAA